MVIAVLPATGTPYAVYAEGTRFLTFLVGSATVVLAIPLSRQLTRLKEVWLPVTVASTIGRSPPSSQPSSWPGPRVDGWKR